MSTKILDGPAAEHSFLLTRAPLFLRVVNQSGKWDALDQLADTPAANELVYVYRRHGTPGHVHINSRDPKTGKRNGGMYTLAEYKYFETQPIDSTVRDNKLWQEWVMEMIAVHGDAPYG